MDLSHQSVQIERELIQFIGSRIGVFYASFKFIGFIFRYVKYLYQP